MAAKQSKAGRLTIKLVCEETGEFYTTKVNEKKRKELQQDKFWFMKYSRKLRKKMKFVQKKAD